ncbi:phosphocholine-specific phospholipase C [Pseudoxanthomonas wuyuanensis]|uniref:phospholipase C n=1 Tax=Pseudoxanthomonas wuyuanensis TaxID=1073196 RepID=A0A286DAI8_9GAMM|nr:phospholipase C, phosphocholine-specific [Pseudoxanthomonas wuyuanensis]KAF1720580.1 phospholipase C, phosphocholine-specific [Pseudoxanthomonas wuyuanensis]SOD55658.1 phospholipase C [Pseudoxanthomonas wuyuanensis]
MTDPVRRRLLAAAAAAGAGALLPPSIARALSIAPDVCSGTLQDVAHVVILMQENRSFDHYFGTLAGVRGFGDRFPIPAADAAGAARRNVWLQPRQDRSRMMAPFALDTAAHFGYMRVEGTPHSWPDAQHAWDHGRMADWPASKHDHSLGYYRRADIPFQFALAEAFTVCDAYHASMQAGTNPNRLFLWTGGNDPHARGGGPAVANSHDNFAELGGHPASYSWTTYTERLQRAGVSWQIYQDMADNFTDNPLAGFETFRQAYQAAPGHDSALRQRGVSTCGLDRLRHDVREGRLPQVSYLIAPAAASEHPGPSSPAQGAAYTAQVLDALTANPKVWSRTVLLLMFDENDGFFDHMPPPAPPSRDDSAPDGWAGASMVSTEGEYHLHPSPGNEKYDLPALRGRPYGLGPRVPLYVISPWSAGGWVDSEVFDHTSVIRLLEKRFGVPEPNISPWRRAVCGDLTSAFDFARVDQSEFLHRLPATAAAAARAAALPGRATPAGPADIEVSVQETGVRRSRALPYRWRVHGAIDTSAGKVALELINAGTAAAVLQVYDRHRLDRIPRRYTVAASGRLQDRWLPTETGAYDLWLLGPNGFHRHYCGRIDQGWIDAQVEPGPGDRIRLQLRNPGAAECRLQLGANAYAGVPEGQFMLAAGEQRVIEWASDPAGGWYDLRLTDPQRPDWQQRLAGRVETGRDSISDPAMGGAALLWQEPAAPR